MKNSATIQIRYDDGSTSTHESFREAMNIANMGGQHTRVVNKVSFFMPNGDHVRLVLHDDGTSWVLESMQDLLDAQEDLRLN